MPPYQGQALEKFFNANRKKLEAQGVNVEEWNKASKGKKLPKKAHHSSPLPAVQPSQSFVPPLLEQKRYHSPQKVKHQPWVDEKRLQKALKAR